MKENISLLDVARLAGVSRSTVSRAFNDGYVSEEVKKRIEAAVKQLGYRQNLLARNLRMDASSFVGLVIPDISNPFFASLAKALERRFQSHGYGVFLCNTEEDSTIEDFYLDTLLDNRVEAVIVTPVSTRLSPRLLGAGVPVVLADREIPLPPGPFASVTSDNRAGGEVVAQRLAESGARQVLVLGADNAATSSSLEARLAGFEAGVERFGLQTVSYRVPVDLQAAETLVTSLLGTLDIDSVFCTSDLMAFGVMRALLRAQVKIPDEIQIVGYDGLEFGDYLPWSLSTVRQDIGKLGQTIGDTVLEMIQGRAVPPRTVLPVEFVKKESSR